MFAGKLSAFAKVHLITRSGNTTATRFKIESVDGHSNEYSLEPEADPLAEIDWLFVCTKSYDVEQAVHRVSARLSQRSRIVLFGNGMGYQQKIGISYPECTVLIASTTEGANRPQSLSGKNTETICVRHAGKGKTIIGAFKESASADAVRDSMLALQSLNHLLNKAGFDSEVSDNIHDVLWRKLIVNCGINPFTAILDCTNGSILSHPFFLSRIDGLCNELSDAALRAGFAISAQECKQSVLSVATATKHNRSSMLQDCTAEKMTEIDFINGYICRLGTEHYKDYPINEELTMMVKTLTANSHNSLTAAKD